MKDMTKAFFFSLSIPFILTLIILAIWANETDPFLVNEMDRVRDQRWKLKEIERLIKMWESSKNPKGQYPMQISY